MTLLSPARFEDLATDAGWRVAPVSRDGTIYAIRGERSGGSTRRDAAADATF